MIDSLLQNVTHEKELTEQNALNLNFFVAIDKIKWSFFTEWRKNKTIKLTELIVEIKRREQKKIIYLWKKEEERKYLWWSQHRKSEKRWKNEKFRNTKIVPKSNKNQEEKSLVCFAK